MVVDDPLVAESLRLQLIRSGYEVETIPTGSEALTRFHRHDLDLAIVDLILPDIDGIQVIVEARRRGMLAPILVMSVLGDLDNRVRALEVGADDYMVKPVATTEVVARLRALERRATTPRWAPLSCGRVTLNRHGRQALVDGSPVELSPREHALLALLLRRRGQIVTRAEILRDVFGYQIDPGTNVVNVHVAHLRQKLRGGQVVIRTTRGVGFTLRPVTDEPPPEQ